NGMMTSSAANATIGNISGEKLPKSAASAAGSAKMEAATAPLKDSAMAPPRPMLRRSLGSLKAGSSPRSRFSRRAFGQIRGQHGLAVGVAFGVEVDEDFGARKALLELLLDPVHAVVRLAHRPVRRH